jgi:hypothetical protein
MPAAPPRNVCIPRSPSTGRPAPWCPSPAGGAGAGRWREQVFRRCKSYIADGSSATRGGFPPISDATSARVMAGPRPVEGFHRFPMPTRGCSAIGRHASRVCIARSRHAVAMQSPRSRHASPRSRHAVATQSPRSRHAVATQSPRSRRPVAPRRGAGGAAHARPAPRAAPPGKARGRVRAQPASPARCPPAPLADGAAAGAGAPSDAVG